MWFFPPQFQQVFPSWDMSGACSLLPSSSKGTASIPPIARPLARRRGGLGVCSWLLLLIVNLRMLCEGDFGCTPLSIRRKRTTVRRCWSLKAVYSLSNLRELRMEYLCLVLFSIEVTTWRLKSRQSKQNNKSSAASKNELELELL
jgi:hypothetical protein